MFFSINSALLHTKSDTFFIYIYVIHFNPLVPELNTHSDLKNTGI